MTVNIPVTCRQLKIIIFLFGIVLLSSVFYLSPDNAILVIPLMIGICIVTIIGISQLAFFLMDVDFKCRCDNG